MKFFRALLTDIKFILREPIILILTLSPLFMVIAFKLLIIFLLPLIKTKIPVEIDIEAYILITLLLSTPIILGDVMGFLMLDDRDGRMIELYFVTPMGRTGYLKNRLFFCFFFTIIYSIINYIFLGLYILSIPKLLIVTVLLALFAASTGLLFFSLASDKIKGLTYAKGLNILIIFAFTDFFNEAWIRYLGAFFPTYWISRFILGKSVFVYATVVTMLWLVGLVIINNHRMNRHINL